MDLPDGELLVQQDGLITLTQAKLLADMMADVHRAFRHRVQQRFLGVAMLERNLAPDAIQDDRQPGFRPGKLLHDRGQQVVDRDDFRLGQAMDVFLRHLLAQAALEVHLVQILVLGKDDDVEAQPLGDPANGVLETGAGLGHLGLLLGQQAVSAPFVGLQQGQRPNQAGHGGGHREERQPEV